MFLITEDEETPSPATVELLEALRTLSRTGLHAVTYVHAVRGSRSWAHLRLASLLALLIVYVLVLIRVCYSTKHTSDAA